MTGIPHLRLASPAPRCRSGPTNGAWAWFLVVSGLLAAGCGLPPETADTTPTPPPPSTTTPTVPSTTETVSTITLPQPREVDEPEECQTLYGLDLADPIPIDPPDGFSTVSELKELVAKAIHEQPNPRGLMTHALILGADPSAWGEKSDEEDRALGCGRVIRLTHYDDITIWDYPEGGRQVHQPDRGYFYLGGDRAWNQIDYEEWSLWWDGFQGWFDAQWFGVEILKDDPSLIGYAMIAESETAYFRGDVFEGDDAASRVQAELWLDAQGAVMRMLLYFGWEGEELLTVILWNVETLEPTLTGPLPFEPDGAS